MESEINLAIHSLHGDNVLRTDHLGVGQRDAGKISRTPPEANGAHHRTPRDAQFSVAEAISSMNLSGQVNLASFKCNQH